MAQASEFDSDPPRRETPSQMLAHHVDVDAISAVFDWSAENFFRRWTGRDVPDVWQRIIASFTVAYLDEGLTCDQVAERMQREFMPEAREWRQEQLQKFDLMHRATPPTDAVNWKGQAPPLNWGFRLG